MRRLFLRVFAVLCFSTMMFVGSSAQATTFISAASGSWGTPTIWNPNGVPGSGDDVTISSGHIVTLDTTRSSSDLTVNGTLDLAAQSFFFHGLSATNSGGTITGGGIGGTFYFNGVGGAPVTTQTVAGAGNYGGDISVTITNNTGVTNSAGTSFNGLLSFTISGGSVLNLANPLTFTGALIANSGTINGSAELRTQGTAQINNFGAFSAPFHVVSDTTQAAGSFTGLLTIDSGATLRLLSTLTSSDITINGTLNLAAQSFFFDGSSATNSGGTITGGGIGGTFYFNGVGGAGGTTQTVAGAGNYGGDITVTITNNTGVTNSAGTSFNGLLSFTISGGSVLNLANPITFTGALITNSGTINGSAELRTQGAAQINNFGAFSAPFHVVSDTTQAAGSFTGLLTIDSGATLKLTSTLTSGNITIKGTLNLNGQSFFFQGTTYTCQNGTITNGGVGGTFLFNGVGGAGGTTQHIASGVGTFPPDVQERVLNSTTLVLDGDFQASILTVDGGSTLDIRNYTLSLSGTGTPLLINGSILTAGSTIEFDGTLAQSVQTNLNGASFNSLTINNPAGVDIPNPGANPLTIPGTLTLTNGVFTLNSNLTMSNAALIRRSDGLLSGTPAFGASVNVEYFGANPITTGTELPATATVLNNLTINNAAGVTLGGSATVNGTLSLTSGDLNTGTFTLTMPETATSTGTTDVVGNVKRTGFTTANTLSFGNPFNTIQFTSGTPPTDVTVNMVKQTPPDFTNATRRAYTFTPNGGSGYSATLRLHYLDSELNGNSEAALVLWRKDASWTNLGATAVNATDNWVELTGIGQFSPWVISGPSAPCGFDMSPSSQSFAGNGGNGTVNLTASDAGCAWTASTTSPFITITSGGSGTGNGAVEYTVAINAGTTIRSDTITIAGHTFTVYQGINFLDVPSSNPFYNEIGKLAARGVTVGCGNGNYCLNDPVTREQMAAFIMRAKGEFSPPTPPSQRFNDVPPQNVFYNFIDRLAELQITVGCTPDHLLYCPSDPVKREQMAAFLLRGLGEFNPPTPPSQRFGDVPPTNVFYNFIDRLAVLQITLGCTPDHLMYCPSDSVTRAQMAAFLVRAFNL